MNNFVVGEKLETVDPRNQDSWCIGTIIETDGPRLRIRLDGTDDRNDFWRLVDSSEIRSYGTTTKFVRRKMKTKDFSSIDFFSFLGRTNCSTVRFSTNFNTMGEIFRKKC